MNSYKIPSDICVEAKEYMVDVLKRLEESEILENVDSAALDMLARNYSMFINASKQIEKEGATIENVQGNIVKHPAVNIMKDAQIQAVKLMQEFGLTAKSRTKLPKLDKKEDEVSPLEQFVKGVKEIR